MEIRWKILRRRASFLVTSIVSRALENLGARARLALECLTLLASQELASSGFVPVYWEGAVTLTGRKNASPVGGVGYLEMTGYDHWIEALR